VEQEGWGMEHWNLDKKLNVKWDTERIVGTAEMVWEKMAARMETVWEMETSWEKMAMRTKTETETENKMTWKRTTKTGKRTAAMEKTVEETRQTTAVN
jgi:hypothetical protein